MERHQGPDSVLDSLEGNAIIDVSDAQGTTLWPIVKSWNGRLVSNIMKQSPPASQPESFAGTSLDTRK